MKPSDRIITRLPLTEPWDDQGPVQAIRHRDLAADDIRELLSTGAVRFMVADIGAKPSWLSHDFCFAFWKSEVLPHLAAPDARIRTAEYPQGYCYFAAEWRTPEGEVVVVLQRCH